MALGSRINVAAATKKIAVRLGFADQGTARTRADARIMEFISQSINELALEHWADNTYEVRIPLIVGQDRYEYPEEANNGDVIGVECELQFGQRYALNGGIRRQDVGPRPSDGSYRVQTGDPEDWRIIDGEVQIRPAPIDITRVPTLVVTLSLKIPETLEPGTLLPFDSELIIQRCTVLGRRHYQLPGLTDAETEYAAYITRVKARQGAAQTFFVGGNKSHFVTRNKEVRKNPFTRNVGNGAPYTPNWNPW
jgi:hypothetical protein